MKRLSYLLTIVAAIAVVVFLGYKLRSKVDPPFAISENDSTDQALPIVVTTPTSTVTLPTPDETDEAAPVVGLISRNPVADYFVDTKNTVTLIQPDGLVFQVENGNVMSLSSVRIEDLISTEFSFDGKKLLAVFGTRSSPQASIFDLERKAWQPLPAGAHNPVWSPVSHEVAYLTREASGRRTLNILNTDAATARPRIAGRFVFGDITMAWVSRDKVLFEEPPSAAARGSAWFFTLSSQKLTQIFDRVQGSHSIWSDDGNTGLAFVAGANRFGGQVKLVDSEGFTKETLGFFTLPSKCTFDSVSMTVSVAVDSQSTSSDPSLTLRAPRSYPALICAVPDDRGALERNVLPDTYYKNELFTDDSIVILNLQDGVMTNVEPTNFELLVDAKKIKLFNNLIFFINRYGNLLYGAST